MYSMFGDMREMELHYFLADDTIEVVEKIPPNSGRDAVPMFLRRSKLHKTLIPLQLPGVVANRTVLNVFGPMGHGGRYLLDSLKVCGTSYLSIVSDTPSPLLCRLVLWRESTTMRVI